MCASEPQMNSEPRTSQCTPTAIRLPIVPDGTNTAASFPNVAAISSSSLMIVGSSPKTSSPTSASAIARRIAGVGFVTVSDRMSMTSGHSCLGLPAPVLAPPLPIFARFAAGVESESVPIPSLAPSFTTGKKRALLSMSLDASLAGRLPPTSPSKSSPCLRTCASLASVSASSASACFFET